MAGIGPTVARRTVARLLRERREAKGVTVTAAARAAGINQSTMSRIETNVAKVEVGTAVLLFRKYGVPESELEVLEQIAHAARQKTTSPISLGNIPEWFRVYVGLEEDASEIRTYEHELVPGFLQTPEYALALVNSDVFPPGDEKEANVRVKVRETRAQRILDSEKPVSVVLGEAALHRIVGDKETSFGQIEHLLKTSERENISVRILPFAKDHPAHYGRFVILTFPPPYAHEVAYAEYAGGALYLEEEHEVTTYSGMFDRLEKIALGPNESRKEIANALSRFQ